MRLPNPDRAFVSQAKLRDYLLNADHPRGRHKARVFAAALGAGRDDAEWLQSLLIQAAHLDTAVPTEQDTYGQRYVLDFDVATRTGPSVVRSLWIVRTGEDYPRLVTCYVR
jgi:hypothetical protein